MAARIPATVVTGFLGAGKTTLVRRLLEQAGGQRVALIVNEFGELGVDGELLRSCGLEACSGEDIVELANGCICCTVADEFQPVMERLLERPDPPGRIVIETSGLALPQPLVRAFAWPSIRPRVTVDAVVALADAAALQDGRVAGDEDAVRRQQRADQMLDHDTPLGELFEDQLACADIVVLNKTDLVSEAALPTICSRLTARLRPGVRILQASHGRVPVDAVFGFGAAAESDSGSRAERHRHNADHPAGSQEPDHDHADFASFSVRVRGVRDPGRLSDRIRQAMVEAEVYRIKGIGRVGDRPLRAVFQGAGPRVEVSYDRPLRGEEPDSVELVVIGSATVDPDAVAAVLRS